jgi:hypothetical protein
MQLKMIFFFDVGCLVFQLFKSLFYRFLIACCVLNCSSFVSVHYLILIPIFNCVLSVQQAQFFFTVARKQFLLYHTTIVLLCNRIFLLYCCSNLFIYLRGSTLRFTVSQGCYYLKGSVRCLS